MKNEFLNHQRSLALNELGFDGPCLAYFGTDGNLRMMPQSGESGKFYGMQNGIGYKLSAPIIQQAFRFFREKYGLVGLIEIGTHEFSYLVFNIKEDKRITIKPEFNGTYEEAEQACLDKLIELAKESKQ